MWKVFVWYEVVVQFLIWACHQIYVCPSRCVCMQQYSIVFIEIQYALQKYCKEMHFVFQIVFFTTHSPIQPRGQIEFYIICFVR